MKFAILVLPEALSSTIAGPADVLMTASFVAGVNWQIDTVSEFDKTITCFNGLGLTANSSIETDEQYDIIIIPSILVGDEGMVDDHKALIQWLQEQSLNGATIASICTGAFLLAETGMLDGKYATTHWAFANIFRSLYPSVFMDEKHTIVDNGATLCCSAKSAWQDLMLHILEKYTNQSAVMELIGLYQLQRHNTGQQAFYGIPISHHSDSIISEVQAVLKEQLAEPNAMEIATQTSGLTPRTFQRRFKATTGITAGNYLQHLRIERTKELLIFKKTPIEQVSFLVGYESASYLRRLFKKETDMSMREFRLRYAVKQDSPE